MTNRNDKHRAYKQFKNRPYCLAGADRLSAAIWKHGDEASGFRYRFTIFRMLASDGRVSQRFEPADVLCLAKLAHILAITFVDDGWITADLRRRLKLLAARLDQVVTDSAPAPLPDVAVLSTLRCLMDHLRDDFAKHYRDDPPADGFQNDVNLVDEWLRGVRADVVRITPNVVAAARKVLEHFWHEEAMDCGGSPPPGHIFAAMEILDDWLQTVENFGPVENEEEPDESN